MASSPLSGTVTKAPLFVVPAFAQHKELLYFIKCRLYEAGFVIVREEYRFLNAELAECVCEKLDHIPEYVKIASGQPTDVAPFPPSGGITTPPPPPSLGMVGMAYLYVLAHRDCHAKLFNFFADLTTGRDDMTEDERNQCETYAELLKGFAQLENGAAEENSTPLQALWMNTTSDGAKKAVRLLFPRMMAEDIPTGVESREFVHEQLKRSLLPALSDLVKKKPAEPIRWLAERLLVTNTQTPPMIPSEHQ